MKRYFKTIGAAILLALAGSGLAIGQNIFPYTTNPGDGSVTWTVPQYAPAHLQRNEMLPPGGRLTLTSNTPIQNAAAAAATAVIYTSYVGNSVPVFVPATTVALPPKEPGALPGSASVAAFWKNLYLCASFPGVAGTCEQTITLGSNWGTNTVFDVFAENNLGATQGVNNPNNLAELCTVAWTNTTTRATALAQQDGMPTNATSATCRVTNALTVTMGIGQGTYLGSFVTGGVAGQVVYAPGAAASGGTPGNISVWNFFNRRLMSAFVQDTAAGHAYTSNVIRQWAGAATMQHTILVGVAEEPVDCRFLSDVTTAAAAGAQSRLGVGRDSTTTITAISGNAIYRANAAAASQGNIAGTAFASGTGITNGLGQHVYSLNEQGDNVNANTINSGSLGYLSCAVNG